MKRIFITFAFLLGLAALVLFFHPWPAWMGPMSFLMAEDSPIKRISKDAGHRPEQGLAMVHVQLFDAEAGSVKTRQTVVVSGDRIQTADDDGLVTIPAGSEVVDGSGATLLPGLFDMHAHLQAAAGLPYIANGVTTVRDLGNRMETLVALKRAWDSGEETGPRILMAGPITDKGGKGVRVQNEQQAKAAIDRFKAAGYVQMKIVGSSFSPDLVAYVARTAHAEGMRLSGHVPDGMRARQFVEAGADEIQHMNFIMENFLPSGVRGDAAVKPGAKLDLDSGSVSKFIELLKQKHTVVDPTLNVFEDKYARRGEADSYYRAMLGMLQRLYRAGVPLVIGTDAPRKPGVSLHHEMEIWVAAGIPPATVLQLATIGAARVMRVDAETGSIRAGKLADLVLVDGDPLRDISAIGKIRMVVKNGAVYRGAAMRAKD